MKHALMSDTDEGNRMKGISLHPMQAFGSNLCGYRFWPGSSTPSNKSTNLKRWARID
jgi:hypothetical protein